jgi:predicted signal transduction protein with EAL and GGDEF domain
VTISLGIAMNDPKVMMPLDEIYKNADKALYEAKKAGRNCAKFNVRETNKASSAVTSDERNELLG